MTLANNVLLTLLLAVAAPAELKRLEIQRNEILLSGKSFGSAGTFRKLVGRAHFELDPVGPHNQGVVDLKLAARNASGRVEFSADFYLITPADTTRSNGKLLYEVGNRGTKAALRVFQKAQASADPTLSEHFGDGFLMEQGYSILWMGWQWDVPEGRMRMDLPIASQNGQPISGLVRGNFILYKRSDTAELADRGHLAYEPTGFDNPTDFMTVRDTATGKPQRIPRSDWKMLPGGRVALKGGFAPGMIYDVVYEAKDPRVLGASLAATRDLISHLKSGKDSSLPAIQLAYGWGGSQSGRYLRHFLYEGFNEKITGGKVFDAVFDEVGGAGRGSFNQRFGQASRDAEQHFNFFFPVDLFPFTDGPTTDPFSKRSDSLLAKAEQRKVTPLMFHLLSSSEYYNRAGSLIHTDPLGRLDITPPTTSRIYLVSSTPHFPGAFPPAPQGGNAPETAAPMSPLNRTLVTRALFVALDNWASKGIAPPPSQYPRFADRTLVEPAKSQWPGIPGVLLPPPALKVFQLDFASEPPTIGPQYATLVPKLDADGLDIAGIRLPAIAVPLATYTGWNYRHASAGASNQLAGETGGIFPLTKTKPTRIASNDSRLSIAERYPSQQAYMAAYTRVAQQLIQNRFLLAVDLPEVLQQGTHFWETFNKP